MNQQLLHGLTKIAAVIRQEAWRDAGSERISPTQAQILTLLLARPRDELRVTSVAEYLAVTAATASDAIRALEEKELLVRRPSKEDRRVVLLQLTKSGRAVAKRVSQWPDFLLSAMDVLDVEEAGVFAVGLTKMIRKLQLDGRISVARMCAHCRYFRPHVYPDSAAAHHCDFVDAPFGNAALRMDCDDFIQAPDEQRERAWNEFLRLGPLSGQRGAEAQLVQIHQKENT